MNFWKNHLGLRATLIILFAAVGMILTLVGWKMTGKLEGLGLMLLFVVLGLILTIVGWGMTGKLEGLGLMCLGIIFLLTALFVYNAPYRK